LKRISVRIPEAQVNIMEKLIKNGTYKSKSDIVREAVRDLLRRQLWLITPSQRMKYELGKEA